MRVDQESSQGVMRTSIESPKVRRRISSNPFDVTIEVDHFRLEQLCLSRKRQKAARWTHAPRTAESLQQLLEPEVVDLNRHVKGLDEILRRTLGDSIEVRITPCDDLWSTRIDPSQVENAILKLRSTRAMPCRKAASHDRHVQSNSR